SRRNEEEGIDRNEHGEEPIPLDGHEPVLQRRDDEEDPEKRAMIRRAGGSEGDEFAKSKEREQREEDDRSDAAGQQRQREDRRHDPPGADPRVEVVDHRVGSAELQKLADDGGHEQDAENASEQPERLSIVKKVHHRRSSRMALRARSRNGSFSSPISTRI